MNSKLTNSIDKGISFLATQQYSNGEFRCYMSNNEDILAYDGDEPGWFVEDGVVFPTVLIGNSLLFLSGIPQADVVMEKVTHFLLSQRKAGSVWNHFTPQHYLFSLCPFDLDDTACASVFLKKRHVDFPSNEQLLMKNINGEKLFYTWITFRLKIIFNKVYWRLSFRELKKPIQSFFFWRKMACNRNDIDLVVNANMLYYLQDTPNAPEVINFIIDSVKEGREIERDKWYKNILTTYYFISRNYYSGCEKLSSIKEIVINRIVQMVKPDGSIGESVLDTALAICALLNFKYDNKSILKSSIIYLLEKQDENGSWAKRGFYFDGPKKLVSWGSEELSTGLCLEALWRYKQEMNEKNISI